MKTGRTDVFNYPGRRTENAENIFFPIWPANGKKCYYLNTPWKRPLLQIADIGIQNEQLAEEFNAIVHLVGSPDRSDEGWSLNIPAGAKCR